MASKNRKLRKALAKQKRLQKQLALEGKNGINMATYIESDGKPKLTTAIEETNAKLNGKSPSYDNYYGYMGAVTKSCSHFPHKVVTVDDVEIYAATKSQIDFDSAYGIDLIVNCSDGSLPKALTSITNALAEYNTDNVFASLNTYIRPLRELWLDWADGSIYPVGLEFWQSMHDIIKTNNYTSICFTCFGGHGRTGTGLLSYVIANSNICNEQYETIEDALIKLHNVYCHGAVETWIQEEYLGNLLKYRVANNKTRPNTAIWENDRPAPTVMQPAITKIASPANTNETIYNDKHQPIVFPDTTDTRDEFERANEMIKAEIAKIESGNTTLKLDASPNPKLWDCPTKECKNKVTYDELYCSDCNKRRGIMT